MTYTGEMVLPRNAVVMQEEEMRYVEGGFSRTYTKKQSYNNYVLMYATGWTAWAISMCVSVLNTIAGVALACAAKLTGTIWNKYEAKFKKAGTGNRKGCKVTFTNLINWQFKYLY